MLKSTLFFFFLSLISSLFLVSSSSIFFSWTVMELVTLFFIPILIDKDFSYSSSMGAWKYFVVQVVGSSFFLLGLFSDMSSFFFFLCWEEGVISLGLVIKLGLPPFSGWVFHVVENMEWLKFFILSSYQKIFPLLVFSQVVEQSWKLPIVLVLFSTLSVIWMIYFSFSNRWSLSLSSLMNLNWLICVFSLKPIFGLFYLLIYSILLLSISFFLSLSGSEFLSSFNSSFSYLVKNLLVFFFFLFLSGMPPLGVFLMKVEISSLMVMGENHFVVVVMLFYSSFSSFLYLKFFFSLILGSSMSRWSSNSLKLSVIVSLSSTVVFYSIILWW